jgi:lysozyme
MKISGKGVVEIAEHEGIVLGPYLDSKNIWTYGVGHTAAAGGPKPNLMPRHDTRKFTKLQVDHELRAALQLFDVDLDKYEARVNEAVKVPLKPHQFDALVSFDFNTGGIFKAALTRSLNAGNYDEAADRFMGWLKPKEIIGRRRAEMNLFRSGNYDANGTLIPVYDALGDGRIRHRMTMDSRQLAAMMGTTRHIPSPGFWGWLGNWIRERFGL